MFTKECRFEVEKYYNFENFCLKTKLPTCPLLPTANFPLLVMCAQGIKIATIMSKNIYL